MSVVNKLKYMVSFLLHGNPKKTIANISYLHPNHQLQGKKIIITGGGRGLVLLWQRSSRPRGQWC